MNVQTVSGRILADANIIDIAAFTLGWDYGKRHGVASPREAEENLRANLGVSDARYVDLFCNGADDGARGDTFRTVSAPEVARAGRDTDGPHEYADALDA